VQRKTSFGCSSPRAPTDQPIRSGGTRRASRTIIWPEYAGVGHDRGCTSGRLGVSRCYHPRVGDEFDRDWEVDLGSWTRRAGAHLIFFCASPLSLTPCFSWVLAGHLAVVTVSTVSRLSCHCSASRGTKEKCAPGWVEASYETEK